MAIRATGGFYIVPSNDGHTWCICQEGLDPLATHVSFLAESQHEAELFLTMLEGLPMIVGVSTFLTGRMLKRRDGFEVGAMPIQLEIEETTTGDPND
jgi:hypothetical protein